MKIKLINARFLIGKRLLIMTMKAFVFLLCTTVFSFTTENSFSQEKVKINQNQLVSVDQVFEIIQKQSNYHFIYPNKLFKNKPRVQLKKGEIEIAKLLKQILDKSNFDFELSENNTIFIKEKVVINEVKQEQEINGIVTDAHGQPLPGANVIEKGTSNGSQTDFDGKFSLEVNKNAILVVSYLGFVTREIGVEGQTNISIILQEDAESLDEVIIVGYGTQKKGNVTGSVASVNSEELTQVSATNTSALLAGRLPGLLSSTSTGQPGEDTPAISIRGFGSALTVVDGIIRDFNQIDPNEIESISILKDASAAVYGARAGNGVILITTKKGGRNKSPSINLSSSTSMQQPTFLPKIANAAQYAQHLQNAELNTGVPIERLTFSDEDIAKYKAKAPGFEGTDWQDVVLRDWAPMQQHNINMSGGTDNINYFVSIGNLNQKSILKSDDGNFSRFNIASNIDVSITEKLNLGLNIRWREEDRESPISRPQDPSEYAITFTSLISANPTVLPIPNDPSILAAVHPLDVHPVAASNSDISGFTKDKRKQLDLTLSLGYKLPIDGLSVNSKVAIRNNDRLYRGVKKPFDLYKHNPETGENTIVRSNSDDFVNVQNIKLSEVTTILSLNYDKQFGNHNIAALGLMENAYTDRYELEAEKQDLISSDDIPYLFGGSGTQTNTDRPDQNGRKSFVGRLNYNYKEKYLVEALVRADASIRFPTDTRWGYFPGVSLGWKLSEESFLKENSTINYLKLRASYGQLGNDNTSEFDYLTGFELQNRIQDKYGFGDQVFQSTFRTLGLANAFITWENITTYNIGLDATFWNGKLGVEFDAFYRKRTGILANRDAVIPNTFGADLPQENLEERDNRGFELVLNHRNNIGEFRYNVSGNVTFTREKHLLRIEPPFDPDNPDVSRINNQTGQRTNRIFGYKTNGFWNSQAELDANTFLYPDEVVAPERPGDIKFVDTNNDGSIDFRDQVVIGRGDNGTGTREQPELFFGLNMDMTYKGFDLSMLWQGAAGIDVYPNPVELNPRMSTGGIPFAYITENSWTPETALTAVLPAPIIDNLSTHNDHVVDMYLRDGKYLRLKSINFGFSFPQSILEKVNIKNARVFLSASNLLTIKPKSIFDIDPEVVQGASLNTYPLQKIVTLGVNIGI